MHVQPLRIAEGYRHVLVWCMISAVPSWSEGVELRAAVDASVSWYDALCALHGVSCGIEDDVWFAHSAPPPLHSAVKTLERTARADRAVAAAVEGGGIADSFGVFDLSGEGFALLFEAEWIFRPAATAGSRQLPPGWVSVVTATELAAWTSRHDTQAVLLPDLLNRSAFRVVGRADAEGDGYEAGAVLHLGTGVVDVSNVWTTASGLDWDEVVAAAAAVFPGRALVGYEYGPDLEAAHDAGFTSVGPQRVWAR